MPPGASPAPGRKLTAYRIGRVSGSPASTSICPHSPPLSTTLFHTLYLGTFPSAQSETPETDYRRYRVLAFIRDTVREAQSKVAGMKRLLDGEEGNAPAKRSRRLKETTFRFLDLPGELRNRIYEFACEISHQSFPATSFHPRPKRGRRKPASPANTPLRPIPFLGLSQSCSQIRTEFRALWLCTHKVPLCVLDSYLSAFFPPPPKANKDRLETYGNAAGKLRIYVREDELNKRDILELIKHKARFPEHTISFDDFPGRSNGYGAGLEDFLNRQHPKWLRWIRGRSVVSQVRIEKSMTGKLHIVLKEQHSESWMKPTLHKRIPDGYLAELGLDNIRQWQIDFGVDYS